MTMPRLLIGYGLTEKGIASEIFSYHPSFNFCIHVPLVCKMNLQNEHAAS